MPVDEQGIDLALAVLRLTRRYSAARPDASCRVALDSSVRFAHTRASAADLGYQAGPARRVTSPAGTQVGPGRGRPCRVLAWRGLLGRRAAMTIIDAETKRKLREMGAPSLVTALEAHDDELTVGMPFAERVKRDVVDDAHATFNQTKFEGLIRRAGPRYPNADLRRIDLSEQSGLDRAVIAQLGTCAFVDRRQNLVFQNSADRLDRAALAAHGVGEPHDQRLQGSSSPMLLGQLRPPTTPGALSARKCLGRPAGCGTRRRKAAGARR